MMNKLFNIKECKITNKEEYLKLNKSAEIRLENKLRNLIDKETKINYKGYCKVCDKKSEFTIDKNYGYIMKYMFRESVVCNQCNLNNRQRYMMYKLSDYSDKKIYMYEQVTHFFNTASQKFNNLIGSEYISDDIKSGEIIDNIMHQDALNLSFTDNSFDIIVSNDVFEHIPDIKKALKEAYRVLKNNGKLLVSIPFNELEYSTNIRAKFDENNHLIYIETPEYHGNPMSDEGSLVFYDYGWDFLDMLKASGFKDVYATAYNSKKYAHIGNGIIFEAVK